MLWTARSSGTAQIEPALVGSRIEPSGAERSGDRVVEREPDRVVEREPDRVGEDPAPSARNPPRSALSHRTPVSEGKLRWARRHPRTTIVAGGVVAILALLWATSVGASDASIVDVARSIWLVLTGAEAPEPYIGAHNVIMQLRIPRTLLAFLAGAVLTVAGIVLQGLLRNDLVSPYTLGVSPAAAFGASLVILLARDSAAGTDWLITLSAIFFALLASVLVLSLGAVRKMAIVTLVLLGIAFTQLFDAFTDTFKLIADENTLSEIVHWAYGSVNGASWGQVAIVGVALLFGFPYFQGHAKRLNAIAFVGDDTATSLGVNVPVLRGLHIGIAVVLTAIVVSFVGVVGFIGLVGPHIARFIIGSDHRYLYVFGVIVGGTLLVAADVVGKVIMPPTIIPLGIVIAFIGVPLFLHLVIRGGGARS
ncbi:iron ABC transporter permease [Agromyces intestinalis]|uniref:Iron ABC transporter permease n=1 Tax=Agromyces intestinalis TaxID=2592652 RepID=A0A5C1YE76_9MICO|nr:iron ABC transporter permease [Agromyces intestinalis]QEO14393.1 iron ABC transporter permease [Agromyces intestinalis]